MRAAGGDHRSIVDIRNLLRDEAGAVITEVLAPAPDLEVGDGAAEPDAGRDAGDVHQPADWNAGREAIVCRAVAQLAHRVLAPAVHDPGVDGAGV